MPELESIDDLTGTWRGDDGSISYIRQVDLGTGTQIYWSSNSYSFSNIFMGYRVGSSIMGQWVDVPQQNPSNIGTITLEVVSPTVLLQIAATKFYGTKIWTKVKSGFPM